MARTALLAGRREMDIGAEPIIFLLMLIYGTGILFVSTILQAMLLELLEQRWIRKSMTEDCLEKAEDSLAKAEDSLAKVEGL